MQERWEITLDARKCVCELRDGVVHAAVSGRGRCHTKQSRVGKADAHEVGLKLCLEIITQLVAKQADPIVPSPECVHIQMLRFEILSEMSKLEEKRDHYTSWPSAVVQKFAQLRAEQHKLREEWIRLGCASQLLS